MDIRKRSGICSRIYGKEVGTNDLGEEVCKVFYDRNEKYF